MNDLDSGIDWLPTSSELCESRGTRLHRYESMQHRILANSIVDPGFYPLTNGEPCWLWFGARSSANKYGALSARVKIGPNKGKRRCKLAHRESLKAFKPHLRLTSKMVAKHLCNVPLCVNPTHLQGGTPKSNIRQCVRQGRHWSGFKGKKPKGEKDEPAPN